MEGEMARKEEVVVLVVVLSMFTMVAGGDVTYDGRALIINGTRRMLFSGSIHYPRSTPEVPLSLFLSLDLSDVSFDIAFFDCICAWY